MDNNTLLESVEKGKIQQDISMLSIIIDMQKHIIIDMEKQISQLNDRVLMIEHYLKEQQ